MSIETDVEVLKSVVTKLDTSIDKITQVSVDIGKILSAHEARIDGLEKIADDRDDDIKDLHSRISTMSREIADHMDLMENRIYVKLKENSLSSTEQHDKIQREIESEIEKLGSRLTILENWRWWILGAAAALGFVLGKMDLVNIVSLLN
jgi:chromosome segregation ATPase